MNISKWLFRISSGWLTLAATVIFVLFMIFVLPAQAAKADETAQGTGSPDTSFFYKPEELFEFAEVYGEAGRQAYIRARFTFDLIYPLVYGSFLALTLSWFLERGLQPGSRWRVFNLVPVLGVVFDYLENIATSLVMGLYPTRVTAAAFLASGFTLVKWVFVNGSFVVLLMGLILWLVNRVKKS
jgi:hypothetical protein